MLTREQQHGDQHVVGSNGNTRGKDGEHHHGNTTSTTRTRAKRARETKTLSSSILLDIKEEDESSSRNGSRCSSQMIVFDNDTLIAAGGAGRTNIDNPNHFLSMTTDSLVEMMYSTNASTVDC